MAHHAWRPLTWALHFAAVLVCGSSSGVTPLEFSTAINVAGRQRMLSQRMSKEFLLIAKGHEVDANKEALSASINLFHTSLSKLIHGSAADGIPAAPSANSLLELNNVETLWAPFKAMLEDNMNKSPIPDSAISYIVSNNIPLLKQANAAVSRLVDAAKGAGIATAGLQVDTAGRQRMLSQRMSKEVMMIALDIDVQGTLQALRGTMDLFEASHKGLLRGQPFLGLTETRNICTLQQMRLVSDLWKQFRALLRNIIYGSGLTPTIMQDVAALNPTLLKEMNNAVTLYVTGPSDCPQTFTDSDWLRVLREAGDGELTIWKVGRLFIQIALGVDTSATSTLLQAQFSRAEALLRSLIEGSVANQIRSPPTQPIANLFIDAWNYWAKFHENVMGSIASPPIRLLDLERSFGYGEVTYSKFAQAFAEYAQAASADSPQLHVGAAGLVKDLGVTAERMVYEAFNGQFKRDMGCAVKVQTLSTAFARAKDELLKGRPAAAGVMAVSRTQNACVLRHMQKVSTHWEPLSASAARFAQSALRNDWGDAELPLLAEYSKAIHSPLLTAMSLYTLGPETCDLAATGQEWEALILASGRLVVLSQIVLTEMAVDQRGVTLPWSDTKLGTTLTEIDAVLTQLTYGAPANNLPSPPTQAIADLLFVLRDHLSPPGGRRLAANSVALASAVEALPGLYAAALQQAQSSSRSDLLMAVAPARIQMAVSQWVTVERLARLAAELQPGATQGVPILRQEMVNFDSRHQLLLRGTPGLERGQEGFVPETVETMILPQLQNVLDELGPVKAQVEAIAAAGYAGTAAITQLSFDVSRLAIQTEKMVQLYGTSSRLSQVMVARLIVPLPMTGNWAPGGVMRVAATVAEEIINTQQRILPGINIKAEFFDDKCNDRDGMRKLLKRVTSNTSWVGLGGMSCSQVCASTAIVASSVRLPAVSYGCSASYLSDQTMYPGFKRLGTVLTDDAATVIAGLKRRYNWGTIVVYSLAGTVTQEPEQVIRALDGLGVDTHWETATSGNFELFKTKAKYLLANEHRQVMVLGDEHFVRSMVCAAMVTGISPGMTWIVLGSKKKKWIQDDDPIVTGFDARCTGAALSDFMQGTLKVRGTGLAEEDQQDEPLDCLRGYTPQSFLDLVEERIASMNTSEQREGYGALNRYGGIAGSAADGTCVFAYALRSLQDRGYSLADMEARAEDVYSQTLAYLDNSISFKGVTGNVTFNGNDKPGDIGVWQYIGTYDRQVGELFTNGTLSLDLHGGVTDEAWRPHPQPPKGARIPWEIIAAVVMGVLVCAACIGGGYSGMKAVRDRGQVKAAGRADNNNNNNNPSV